MTSPFHDRHHQSLSWSQAVQKIINRIYNYFLDAKVALLWCLGYIPSHLFRRLLYVASGITLGKGSTIHIGARFYQPKHITIGQGTIIGDHATLDGRASLTIGNHVDIASEVMIFNAEHDVHHPGFNSITASVTIKDYCFIGPRAIIMPGVTLEYGAVVAAGAIVTKNVAANTIVAGIPAKPIGQRAQTKHTYQLGRPRLFQ